tara:strand:+ start:1251 stop:1439 length:189 start_codon:yes stop_codon:yes gene_type:complete
MIKIVLVAIHTDKKQNKKITFIFRILDQKTLSIIRRGKNGEGNVMGFMNENVNSWFIRVHVA